MNIIQSQRKNDYIVREGNEFSYRDIGRFGTEEEEKSYIASLGEQNREANRIMEKKYQENENAVNQMFDGVPNSQVTYKMWLEFLMDS